MTTTCITPTHVYLGYVIGGSESCVQISLKYRKNHRNPKNAAFKYAMFARGYFQINVIKLIFVSVSHLVSLPLPNLRFYSSAHPDENFWGFTES